MRKQKLKIDSPVTQSPLAMLAILMRRSSTILFANVAAATKVNLNRKPVEL
ncbi:hypothetical protein H6G89_19950 [Oscillatoria sp. FACHB-1407]|uniref:hypothetical protein n=1 Tax=Oscillatoria sp. FACHB-1407 TaxID=2692847 RepID=UPI001684F722|nr:hypothetical protein [Oscillatoria sp. FACHB-1407]MBD2463313.1 hypothetical protein [Oscillatoria sp. FACHB-1407]